MFRFYETKAERVCIDFSQCGKCAHEPYVRYICFIQKRILIIVFFQLYDQTNRAQIRQDLYNLSVLVLGVSHRSGKLTKSQSTVISSSYITGVIPFSILMVLNFKILANIRRLKARIAHKKLSNISTGIKLYNCQPFFIDLSIYQNVQCEILSTEILYFIRSQGLQPAIKGHQHVTGSRLYCGNVLCLPHSKVSSSSHYYRQLINNSYLQIICEFI